MTTTTSAPLFGVRDEDQEPTCDFKLRAYAGDGTHTDHEFTARTGIDASSVLAFSAAGSDGAAIGALQKFLIRVLIDSDGVSRSAEPEPVLDDEPEDSTALAVRTTMHTGDWELGGQTFPTRDLAVAYGDENGSSLRRFGKLMDDPFAIVHVDALQQILRYVVEQSGRRPTQRSSASARRRTKRTR